MAGKNGYPKRDSHFAHRQFRLMAKVCAAQEIGPESALLVAVIAHTEDAKRYSGPVTFYNGQLMPILGMSSVGRLNRARERAVAAGWLHYEAGGKSKPGVYWAKIPDQFSDLPDTAVDESPQDLQSQNATENPPAETNPAGDFPSQNATANEPEGGESISSRKMRSQIATLSGRQTECIRTANEHLSSLALDPLPGPKTEEAASAACAEPPQAACPAPLKPAPVPSEFEFPTAGKGPQLWTLPQAKLDEYLAAYPGLDVLAEMRKARQWCRDNERRRKTAGGMLAFLTSWLNRAQNRLPPQRVGQRPQGDFFAGIMAAGEDE